MKEITIRNKHAFIDEYGTSELDTTKERVSKKFILSAALFDRSTLEDEKVKLENIRKKHFQTGEMKSSKIGNNHKRRIRILRDIAEIDFKIYAYIIDKEQIVSEGLKHKKSFYKFLNSQIDSDLFSTFPDLKISADRIGSEEYMISFKKYIENKHMPDLFDEMEFGFSPSPDDVFVQLSDFISGTLARKFNSKVYTVESNTFMEILENKILNIIEWPSSINFFKKQEDVTENSKFDNAILETSLHTIDHHIELNKNSRDEKDVLRVATLRFLLMNFKYIDSNRFITADEIIDNISYLTERTITKQFFMQQIIAKLRDKAVLIASSPYGYKVPSSWNDIDYYVGHSQTVILPMVNRLRHARRKIKLATEGKYDIVESRPFLKGILSGINNDEMISDE